MEFYLNLLFYVIQAAALLVLGYSRGKSDGLRQGRKDLADYALSQGRLLE